jgi:hypothetical protein
MAGINNSHPAAGGGGSRWRHAQDEAKGAAGMQLFSAPAAIFFYFSLTRATICPNQLRLPINEF